MFSIVETKEELKRLLNFRKDPAYVELIPGNYNYHPRLTNCIGVYVFCLSSNQSYLLPIAHPDGIGLDKELIKKVLGKFKELYVWDKKAFFYHFLINNLTDVQLLISLNKYEKIDLPTFNSTINYYYNKFGNHSQVNSLIPITKLIETCENNLDILIPFFKFHKDISFDFYNNTATKVFYMLEQSGLRVTYEAFVNMFKPNNPSYNVLDNISYTYYNLYNTTCRPTNSFNSINYAAIPHKDEYRKTIIPKNDKFVEYDFDGYHLRLLCNEIGYDLTEESAHTQIARLYYNKEEITEEEYVKAKQMNFQALYGNIPQEYKKLPLFIKIQEYIDKLWLEFNAIGSVLCPLSNRKYTEELKDMNPPKLMNYVMQNLETSNNILILKDVLNYLKDKSTSIALYTYDAILFDYNEEDGKGTLNDLKTIMSKEGKYPVNYKLSNNLVL